MGSYLASKNKLTLVAMTTLCSVLASLLILYLFYTVLGVGIRASELLVATLAPLIIATIVSGHFGGMIKRLESLEEPLRESICKEKEAVYLATIHGSQHITNNLLNGLLLIDMEIKKLPTFDSRVKRLFLGSIEDSKRLLDKLSSVEKIDPEEIRNSVAPRYR
mgnify:CR=1 FL=1